MPDVLLTEARQRAVRALLAAEPVPGRPIPTRDVFDALAQVVACDVLGGSLTDADGRELESISLAPGPSHRTRVIPSPWPTSFHEEGDGPHHLGWIHWTRRPELAAGCCELVGADELALGFRSGADRVVQLGFMRETGTFAEDDLALLRMVMPQLGRLVRERQVSDLPASLTVCERRVLGHVAVGRSNAEIAELLCVAVSTVRKHLENAYPKLGVSNRLAAATCLHALDRDTSKARVHGEIFA